jgi:coenzyme F420-0:L-glutamate ligase/coenzyme F420-1:gamma-L-glutamate ligase|tara:strand:+ start:290 stop:1048 length:759 start_codon:yes stop_codon:yes gene_type:complete
MSLRIEIIAVPGLPEVVEGDNLSTMIYDAVRDQCANLEDGDVVVVAQKIVSKSEGAVVDLKTITPSEQAHELAETVKKDPRLVEVILQQSAQIVRTAPGVLITETIHGLVCANSGVDSSNSAQDDHVIILPPDPDKSARGLKSGLEKRSGVRIGIVVSDSFGRPWREGSTNIAVGIAGFEPLEDARGRGDDHGRVLHATVVAVADELASAAQLVMGEFGGVPAAIVRGAQITSSDSADAGLLQRSPKTDLFR